MYIQWTVYGCFFFRALKLCVVIFACYWAGTFSKPLAIPFVFRGRLLLLNARIWGVCVYMAFLVCSSNGVTFFSCLYGFISPSPNSFPFLKYVLDNHTRTSSFLRRLTLRMIFCRHTCVILSVLFFAFVYPPPPSNFIV